MERKALTGTRIRERRIVLGLKQADLARQAEISASYLNLIEHNRRRIGGKLLGRIAKALSVDVVSLNQGADTAMADQLGQAAAAAPDVTAETDQIDEFVGRFRGWAELLTRQQARIDHLEHKVESLQDRLAHDPFLSTALHDLLSKVASIQSTSAILNETGDLDQVWEARFHRNLAADSRDLAARASALADHLYAQEESEFGIVSPQEELEGFLAETGFHIPALEGADAQAVATVLDQAAERRPRSEAGLALTRVFLERYRRDALAMPLGDLLAAARNAAYDPGRLSEHFDVDITAVFRRLSALPLAETGQPIGFAKCDGSGALTLRKSTELLPLPRFGSACPLWPLYHALTRPMTPVRAVLEHAGQPGQLFLAFAIASVRYPQGFAGPSVTEAAMVALPRSLLQPADIDGPVQVVGTSCRFCAAADCAARREPSILADGFDTRS